MVRIFPKSEACLRLLRALTMEQSDEWISGRRYLDVGLLDESPVVSAPLLAAD